jgi:hypothetical protein
MVVTADDDQQLVVAVNRHMAAAHDSFELEEVVLDAAGDAPAQRTRQLRRRSCRRTEARLDHGEGQSRTADTAIFRYRHSGGM